MELTAGLVWLLVAAALVLFMTPGLAFFYGGMTRAKSALNMMMMSFVSIGTVGVMWVLWGASMAHEQRGQLLPDLRKPVRHLRAARLHRPGGSAQGRLRRHLRHHHGGADLAARSPTAPSSAPGWSSPPSGPRWSTARWPTWSGAAGSSPPDGWFGQTFAPGHRLRRRHRRAHQRRRRRPDPGPDHRQPQGLRQGPEPPPAQRPVRDAGCRDPLVRLVRLQRRCRRDGGAGRPDLGQHPRCPGRRNAWLAGRGTLPRRPPDLARCRIRCGRRPGRHHPGLRQRLPGRCARASASSPVWPPPWPSA